MALKIRLSRQGGKKNPVYFVVVSETKSKRDGAAIEKLGIYQPKVTDAAKKLTVDREKYAAWQAKGAIATRTVGQLLKAAPQS